LFELDRVGCRRGSRDVLREVTLAAAAGELIAVCGLNGAGKSTLIETMARVLPGYRGSCRFQGRELRDWNPRMLARRISYLPQIAAEAARFTGAEVVRMGRYPFAGFWGESDADRDACRAAMVMADCEALAARYLEEMSGGERQRVMLAAVLAQEPAALLLDEPGTFVDLPHQIAMFRTLRDLCAKGLLCIAATHDLNLAAAFASRILLLDGGAVAADASPAEVLGGVRFREVFGRHIRIERDSEGGVRVHYHAL
jgi:iron complex transport system ATP-binding protein